MKTRLISHRGLLIVLMVMALGILLVLPVLAADCPSGCSCLLPDDAKKLGYEACSEKQVICSYNGAQQPMYCYKNPVSLVVPAVTLVPVTVATTTTAAPLCPSGCSCLLPDDAKKLGYEACSGKQILCSYDKTQQPMYCYQKPVSLVVPSISLVPITVATTTTAPPQCPEGCECLTDDQAQARYGAYQPCSNVPCAQAVTGSAVIKAYCYKPACPSGCECLTDAQARVKFGDNGYTRCSDTSCGSESMTTAAAVVSKYCYQSAAVVLPAGQCQAGCSCMSEATAKEKGYPACRGERTSCGYGANQEQLFCFEVVPSTSCTFDYQSNACTGTCQQGYSCSIIAQEKDATGAVKYGVCGCQPPATECTYNANLNACTGTCKEGTCVVTGKKTDASGAVSIVCGCESPACLFDYAKDACTGSCPAGSGVCQLNTIYRDAAGKTIYGECHCKGAATVTGTVTPKGMVTSPAQPCGTDPVSGQCEGVCPADQVCGSYNCTIDSTGRKVCTDCRCIGCEMDPVTRWCGGYCPTEGTTCVCNEWTRDSLGKVSCNVESGCACKETCTLTATNECVGPCPNGGPCERLVSRDEATGAEKVSCVCRGEAVTPGAAGTSATPTATAAAPAPDIISAIANFFRSLFGMK